MNNSNQSYLLTHRAINNRNWYNVCLHCHYFLFTWHWQYWISSRREKAFMVQVSSRLYMFLEYVLRPFLNKVITWVGIGTMFLILTFCKKVSPLLFISDHFFASPCFMMRISLHQPQSSLLTTLNHPCFHCAIIFHFVLLVRCRRGSWSGSASIRRQQWLHQCCI